MCMHLQHYDQNRPVYGLVYGSVPWQCFGQITLCFHRPGNSKLWKQGIFFSIVLLYLKPSQLVYKWGYIGVYMTLHSKRDIFAKVLISFHSRVQIPLQNQTSKITSCFYKAWSLLLNKNDLSFDFKKFTLSSPWFIFHHLNFRLFGDIHNRLSWDATKH